MRIYISPYSSYNERCFRQEVKTKPKHKIYVRLHFPKSRAVNEVIWKYVVQPELPQMIIRRKRIACQITKSTDRHSEYITVFKRQKWLHERLSTLPCLS
jgi:hypothetical protein